MEQLWQLLRKDHLQCCIEDDMPHSDAGEPLVHRQPSAMAVLLPSGPLSPELPLCSPMQGSAEGPCQQHSAAAA